jgi:hypothetical protein
LKREMKWMKRMNLWLEKSLKPETMKKVRYERAVSVKGRKSITAKREGEVREHSTPKCDRREVSWDKSEKDNKEDTAMERSVEEKQEGCSVGKVAENSDQLRVFRIYCWSRKRLHVMLSIF